MHEHPGQEVEWIEGLGHSQAPVSLSTVENLTRGLVDPHSVKADWRMEQIAGKALDLVMVLRLHRYTVVRREAAVIPAEQHLDALVREQSLRLQKGDHLAPEQKLGSLGIDVGYRHP